jgi:hypothetical protein
MARDTRFQRIDDMAGNCIQSSAEVGQIKLTNASFGPALLKLEVAIEMLSSTEYNGQLLGSVLNWQGNEEGIHFTLYTQGRLLGRKSAHSDVPGLRSAQLELGFQVRAPS